MQLSGRVRGPGFDPSTKKEKTKKKIACFNSSQSWVVAVGQCPCPRVGGFTPTEMQTHGETLILLGSRLAPHQSLSGQEKAKGAFA
jgi:hypothetical protein